MAVLIRVVSPEPIHSAHGTIGRSGALFEVDDTDELLDPGRPNPLVAHGFGHIGRYRRHRGDMGRGRTGGLDEPPLAVTLYFGGKPVPSTACPNASNHWQSARSVPTTRLRSSAGTVMILAGTTNWAAARVIRWDWRRRSVSSSHVGGDRICVGRLRPRRRASGFVPTLVAASYTLALYWVTDKILTPRPPGLLTVVAGDPRAVDYPAVTPDRRRMLVGGALGVAVASTGLTVLAKNRRTNSAATKARRQLALPVPDTSLPTAPSDPPAKIAGLTPLFSAHRGLLPDRYHVGDPSDRCVEHGSSPSMAWSRARLRSPMTTS